ncbi:MAG: WD40 repeat domain-containing protein, partial [Acidobacteriota bacterium]|nr:WD40 repeat domain-containing protein [Acidobacteriota bacterium]
GLLQLWIDQGARPGNPTSLLPRLKWKAIPGTLNPVYSAAISPDGSYAACGRSNRILVYDLASGQLAARLTDPSLSRGGLYGEPGVSHRDMVHSLAFSPKGGLLVSGGYRTLKFWRLQGSGPAPGPAEPGRGKPELSWVLERVVGSAQDPSGPVGRVTALAFSPDGQLLATGSGDPSRSGEVKIWRAENGELVGEVPDAHIDTILGIEFSPDGRYLATASTDRFARVFEVESRQLAKTFEGHTHHVLDVTWKADGKILATCGADGDIKLWDFETGEQKQTLSGYEKEITSLSFIADSDRLLTSSGDPIVRFGERRLGGVSSFVHVSAVSRDGRTVVAGDQTGRLLVWRSPDLQPLFVLGPEANPVDGPSGK